MDATAAAGPVTPRRRVASAWLRHQLPLHVATAAICLVVVFPIYWMVVISVRPMRYTINYPPRLLPEELRLNTYLDVFRTIEIGVWMRNSAILGLGVMAVVVVLSVLAGYAFSTYHWRGRDLFGFGLLVTQMMPEALLIIPIFIIFRRLEMIDTLQGVVLAHAAFVVPVGVWVLKGFFDTIPTEMREAALVDGCTELGILWRIVLPLSAPAVVTVAVIGFFDGWNEYLFASTFLTSKQLWVTATGLARFIGELSTDVEMVLAGATIFTLAPLVFFTVLQRYIVAGLTVGAVKA